MQTTEINGFVIDQFNQYNLDTKAKQGVCPWSEQHRKPKNHKKKCSSYDWERGLGTCHNCNTTFQLHTYKRKGETVKVYEKPKYAGIAPKDKVVEWFKSRGISQQTLNTAMVEKTLNYTKVLRKYSII